MFVADYIHISKAANGFFVTFHQTQAMPPQMQMYLKKVSEIAAGEKNEIDEIRRKAAIDNAAGSVKVGADKFVMRTYEDCYIFLNADLDKLLALVKYVLLTEMDPAFLQENNS